MDSNTTALSRGKRLALLFGGALGAAGVLGVCFLAWMAWNVLSVRGMCGSHGNYSSLSPDGKYRAVLYEYDCGATTDFGTNLAVVPAQAKFDPFDVKDGQRVLTADSNHQAVGVDMNGILPVMIEWKDAQDLHVTIPRMARVFNRKTRSGIVTIEFFQVD